MGPRTVDVMREANDLERRLKGGNQDLMRFSKNLQKIHVSMQRKYHPASVELPSGSFIRNVVPAPSSLSTSIAPWWASTIILLWKRPIPSPSFFVVLNGWKSEF